MLQIVRNQRDICMRVYLYHSPVCDGWIPVRDETRITAKKALNYEKLSYFQTKHFVGIIMSKFISSLHISLSLCKHCYNLHYKMYAVINIKMQYK